MILCLGAKHPLIAPYWNWNLPTVLNMSRTLAFNRTITCPALRGWNWNCFFWKMKVWANTSFNRTITCPALRGWNWNTDHVSEMIGKPAFNRTILELKLRWKLWLHIQSKPLIAPYWIWNLVSPVMHKINVTFNRTILELKLQLCVSYPIGYRPLIAPYWNWNKFVW